MPSSLGCSSYQIISPVEETKTLATTTVQAIYDTTTLAMSFVIQPHPDNVGVVKIGYGSAPANVQTLSIGFSGARFRYNLADIRVQAAEANDKVIVIYSPYPND